VGGQITSKIEKQDPIYYHADDSNAPLVEVEVYRIGGGTMPVSKVKTDMKAKLYSIGLWGALTPNRSKLRSFLFLSEPDPTPGRHREGRFHKSPKVFQPPLSHIFNFENCFFIKTKKRHFTESRVNKSN
jgi:hypothetical protein